MEKLSGKLKDTASQMKLNVVHLCSSVNSKNIDGAVLKATSHTSNKPPSDRYVVFLQETAVTCFCHQTISAIVQRLCVTTDVCVASKCLILIHSVIKTENGYKGLRGTNSPRNLIYNRGESTLKLNDLNVDASRFTKELAPWVQWYKEYLKIYLCTAEVLGVTPNIKLEEKLLETQRVSSYNTNCIFKQVDFLVKLFENISARPKTPTVKTNRIVITIMGLLQEDYISVIRLFMIRFEELGQRAVPAELISVLVRLENCREALSQFCWRCIRLDEDFWDSVSNLKDK